MTKIRIARVEDCSNLAEIMRDRSDIAFTDVDVITSRLQKNGFGEDPVFHCFVAEDDTTAAPGIIGYAMVSRIYSSWEGKSLRLGDLYVAQDRRRKGIGTELLRRVMKKGAQEFDFKDDTTAMADLKENTFGDWPLVNILVAEDSNGGIGVPCPPLCANLMPSPPLIGCALYSLVFSTWGGRSMVLDGLHVAPAYRGKGVGSALLRAVFKKGAQEFDFKDDTTAMADLKENAFGDWPLVNILVAEDSSGGIGVPCPPLCASLMPSPPLIGCALYSLVFSTWGGRSMVLDGLHVAPAYRGKGVGSALLRAVFKEAAQNKCNELTCHALTKSDAFINLMRRHGGMDQEREKGWHLFEMDKRAITMLTLEQPWTPLNTAASTSKS